jgi:hypothetical protein
MVEIRPSIVKIREIACVVEDFNVWFPKDQSQRVFSPSVDLSPAYFESVIEHRAPLAERHLAASAGRAIAIDGGSAK